MSDADLLLAWRNDAATRAASHSAEPVSLATHVAWLQALLADPDRRQFIALDTVGQAVGAVRADWTGEAYLLSWMLAPEARGKGLGTALLKALRTQLEAGDRAVVLRAEIKDENIASWRMAEAAGLHCVKREAGLRHYIG